MCPPDVSLINSPLTGGRQGPHAQAALGPEGTTGAVPWGEGGDHLWVCRDR